MKMARFFCSNFKESRLMQRMVLFLDLVRERIKDGLVLPGVIVTDL